MLSILQFFQLGPAARRSTGERLNQVKRTLIEWVKGEPDAHRSVQQLRLGSWLPLSSRSGYISDKGAGGVHDVLAML